MKRRTITMGLILAVISLAAWAGWGGESKALERKAVLGIIQYVEHPALDSARQGFLKALEEEGFGPEELEVDYQNAQADFANLSTISDRFIAKKVDLILAIATPAAQAVAGKTTSIPILGTAITDYVAARLVISNEEPGGNVSGTSDLNPVSEQIELLGALFPEAKTVGVLYTSNEDNSILQAQLAKEALESLGLNYLEGTVTNSGEVQQVTQALIRRVDALYIPTDNIFASAMPIVHELAVQAKIPVICGEEGQLLGGGLATLGINYYDLGRQTGFMAAKILRGEGQPATMPIEWADRFEFAVNGQVAGEIGFVIPAWLEEYVLWGE